MRSLVDAGCVYTEKLRRDERPLAAHAGKWALKRTVIFVLVVLLTTVCTGG
jgi:hypothetical protein